MQIKRGTVWHTYTTQSPAYENAEKTALKLIRTGMFLAILTPENTFNFLSNGIATSTKLSMKYENNAHGVKVEGVQNVHSTGVCALTAKAFMTCINIRLSENKLFYMGDKGYSENIICCQKPIIIKNETDEFFLLPIIRLYKNGITHVTFIDESKHNKELNNFIKNMIGLPYKSNNSITTSLEYADLSIQLEFATMSLIQRMVSKHNFKNDFKHMHNSTENLTIEGHVIEGKYIDYAKSLQINHNLSDIARHTIAIISKTLTKKSLKALIRGYKISDFYPGWQGKPNIYILEHDNQKSSALKNQKYNKKLISALLAKNSAFLDEKNNKQPIDFRAFDDFNYFSEQGVALTLCSRNLEKESFPDTYTESNLMWDNQIKSDIREFISFFYESRIEKIKKESSHIGLAKIHEEIITLEEWLRVFSKKYGEIQNFTLRTVKSEDITQARKNLSAMIKSRMQVIKLNDSSKTEKSNRNITIAFGLVASTSLSPIIIKPLFDQIGIKKLINTHHLQSFQETIYYIGAVFFVLITLWLVNKFRRN